MLEELTSASGPGYSAVTWHMVVLWMLHFISAITLALRSDISAASLSFQKHGVSEYVTGLVGEQLEDFHSKTNASCLGLLSRWCLKLPVLPSIFLCKSPIARTCVCKHTRTHRTQTFAHRSQSGCSRSLSRSEDFCNHIGVAVEGAGTRQLSLQATPRRGDRPSSQRHEAALSRHSHVHKSDSEIKPEGCWGELRSTEVCTALAWDFIFFFKTVSTLRFALAQWEDEVEFGVWSEAPSRWTQHCYPLQTWPQVFWPCITACCKSLMLTLTRVYIKRTNQELHCPVSYGLNRYCDQGLYFLCFCGHGWVREKAVSATNSPRKSC